MMTLIELRYLIIIINELSKEQFPISSQVVHMFMFIIASCGQSKQEPFTNSQEL